MSHPLHSQKLRHIGLPLSVVLHGTCIVDHTRDTDTDTNVPIDSDGPTIWLQKSPSTTTERNRIHFDVSFGPRQAQVERFKHLGALVRDGHEDHTVMLDPEGNQFCVFDP